MAYYVLCARKGLLPRTLKHTYIYILIFINCERILLNQKNGVQKKIPRTLFSEKNITLYSRSVLYKKLF